MKCVDYFGLNNSGLFHAKLTKLFKVENLWANAPPVSNRHTPESDRYNLQ